jgi:hypothetical protein
MLVMQKRPTRPVDFRASNFDASVKAEICTGCGAREPRVDSKRN